MKTYIERLNSIMPDLFVGANDLSSLNEIRIRAEKRVYFIYSDKGPCVGELVSKKRFNDIILALCGGNLYKHEDTLLYGYFIDIFGGRCGVACSVIKVKDSFKVNEIHSISIRVPRFIPGAGKGFYDFWQVRNFADGVVIIGKPGVGKTTYIRSLAGLLSQNFMKVCVVDERREFNCYDYPENSNIDILSGYEKRLGLDIAVRTMSADVIICDEIGIVEGEADFLSLANSGVPLIATAHASSLDSLMRKDWFRDALNAGVFGYFVLLYNDGKGKIVEEIGKIC